MTKLGKILVVFTAIMSLAFAAFIAVTTLGGPNWRARAGELDRYGFAEQPGETVTWAVTRRVAADADRNVTTSAASLPAAIVAAQNDLLSTQTEEIGRLDAQIEAVRRDLEAERQASVLDAQGVMRRLAELRAVVDRLDAEIVEVTRQAADQADKARQIVAEVEARRGDVARLAAELEQVRTDRYRVEEQSRQLDDLLVRLDGLIDRAGRRNRQLQARIGGPSGPGLAERP